MWKNILRVTALAAVLALPLSSLSPVAAARDTGKKPWIHIEVTEDGRDGANIKVNLPLSLIEVALEVAGDELTTAGHIELEECDISVHDMRRMWNELRDAGDADFVTVEEGDERVHIYRRGGFVHVEVDDLDTRGEKVRLEIPISVVDALFDSEEENELNLKGALAELQRTSDGEILSVQDGDQSVRIWID